MLEAIDDPGLNYFALGLLLSVIIMIVYGLIAVHDIPAKIAESRHHPHADAIHAAGWVSLFTLHVLWPFLWIWAMAYEPGRGWGFATPDAEAAAVNELKELQRRLTELEAAAGSETKELKRRLAKLEASARKRDQGTVLDVGEGLTTGTWLGISNAWRRTVALIDRLYERMRQFWRTFRPSMVSRLKPLSEPESTPKAEIEEVKLPASRP